MQNTSKHLIKYARGLMFSLSKNMVVIFLLLAVLLVMAYALYRERDVLQTYEWQLNLEYLLIAILAHVLSLGALVLNWHLFIRYFSGVNKWKEDVYVCVISLAARRIPTPIWFIGSRLYLYPRGEISSEVIGLATGIEFGLSGVAGITTYLLMFPFFSFTYNLPWFVIIVPLLLVVTFVVFKPDLLRRIFNKLFRRFKWQQINKIINRKALIAWLSIYIISWILDGISVYFTIAMLSTQLPEFFDVIGAATVSTYGAYLMQFFPLSFGIKEITLSASLGLWIPISIGIITSIVSRILMTVIEILSALFVKFSLTPKTK